MKRSKYNSTKVTFNGIKFDSIKEMNYYKRLRMLKNANGNDRVINIELQPRYDYLITYSANGKEVKRKAFYKGDFLVTYPNRTELVDVKGFRTATYKRKKKIIEALYQIKIIEV